MFLMVTSAAASKAYIERRPTKAAIERTEKTNPLCAEANLLITADEK